MNEHVREGRLNDYVDDLLCHEERMEVQQHLVACAECTAEVARLRDLVTGLAALPAAIRPENDLLQGVHTRIAAGAAPAARRRHVVAAAGVLLAAAAGAMGYALGAQSRVVPVAERAEGATTGVVRSVARVEGQYAAATAELERLLQKNRAELRPETVRILEVNLAAIDRALAEARAALEADPGNPVLEALLVAGHEKKLDLLRRAAQAGA